MYSNSKKDIIRKLVIDGCRLKERGVNIMRPLNIYKFNDIFIVELGNTKVSCKIISEIITPQLNNPNEGLLLFKIDHNNKYESNKINKILEKSIKNSKVFDCESLVISKGLYVWKIIINISIIYDDGNIIDACYYSAIIALAHYNKKNVCVKEGKLEYINNKNIKININHLPINFTFGFINTSDNDTIIFLDPTKEEENILDGIISISINQYNEITNIYKSGNGSISIIELKKIINFINNESLSYNNTIRDYINLDNNLKNNINLIFNKKVFN